MRPYRKFVETALPPVLILGMQHQMVRLGHPQTPGLMHEFAKAAQDALSPVPMMEREMPRSEVRQLCNDLVRGLSPRDPRDLLMATLSFLPCLAENGLHGVLTDLLPRLCLREIRDIAVLGQWRIDEKWITDTTLQILQRARLCGYYLDDGFYRDGRFTSD